MGRYVETNISITTFHTISTNIYWQLVTGTDSYSSECVLRMYCMWNQIMRRMYAEPDNDENVCGTR